MEHIKDLRKIITERLDELGIDNRRVDVRFDDEAREYAVGKGLDIDGLGGYIDIDPYFKPVEEPVVVLVFESKDKFVHGTIAHELQHARQLFDGKIQQNDTNGRFECELEAYKAGMKEIYETNKVLSGLYFLTRIDGILHYFVEYKLKPSIKRN